MARNTGSGSRIASVRGPYGFRHAKSRGGLLRPSWWDRLRRLTAALGQMHDAAGELLAARLERLLLDAHTPEEEGGEVWCWRCVCLWPCDPVLAIARARDARASVGEGS